MYNVKDSERSNANYKQRRNLFNTFKSIANHKDTGHLLRVRSFKKGDLLVEERKPVQGIFLIIEGKVKVFNKGLDQKVQILRLISKGELVGLSSLNSTHYWATAMVMENVIAYFINIKSLKFFLNNNTKLNKVLMNSLAAKLRYYEIRQKHLTLFPATERVIDALFLIGYHFGESTDDGIEISIGASRKDIANLANTSYEKAIRTLSDLKSKNYISITRKRIVIKEKDILIDQLKQICCSNNSPGDLDFCYPNFFY